MTAYAAWWIVFGSVTDPRYGRMMGLLALASANWKAFIALMVLLFFRTIRTFLEEVQEGFGMKRIQRPPQVAESAENPPTPAGRP